MRILCAWSIPYKHHCMKFSFSEWVGLQELLLRNSVPLNNERYLFMAAAGQTFNVLPHYVHMYFLAQTKVKARLLAKRKWLTEHKTLVVSLWAEIFIYRHTVYIRLTLFSIHYLSWSINPATVDAYSATTFCNQSSVILHQYDFSSYIQGLCVYSIMEYNMFCGKQDEAVVAKIHS